jgi:hypothetical protein
VDEHEDIGCGATLAQRRPGPIVGDELEAVLAHVEAPTGHRGGDEALAEQLIGLDQRLGVCRHLGAQSGLGVAMELGQLDLGADIGEVGERERGSSGTREQTARQVAPHGVAVAVAVALPACVAIGESLDHRSGGSPVAGFVLVEGEAIEPRTQQVGGVVAEQRSQRRVGSADDPIAAGGELHQGDRCGGVLEGAQRPGMRIDPGFERPYGREHVGGVVCDGSEIDDHHALSCGEESLDDAVDPLLRWHLLGEQTVPQPAVAAPEALGDEVLERRPDEFVGRTPEEHRGCRVGVVDGAHIVVAHREDGGLVLVVARSEGGGDRRYHGTNR